MSTKPAQYSGLSVRKLNIFDLYPIFKWRNDKDSRKFSYNPKSFNFLEHLIWYLSNFKNSNQYRYIFTLNLKRICFVNFTNLFNNEIFIISINMNPKFRGLGLSRKVIFLAEKQILRDCHECTILAEIHKHNSTSLNLFLGADYRQEVGEVENFLIFSKDLREEF